MDRAIAAQLARLSALAYENIDVVRSQLHSAEVSLLDVDDTQVYLVTLSEEFAATIFRGTQVTANWSWADVRSNLAGSRVGWLDRDGEAVHAGYAEALTDVLDGVHEFVTNSQVRNQPVYLAGHSLGGALATLGASVLDVTATYTFGAPRAGNSDFADGLAGKQLFRIVYGCDIASAYPHPLRGYRHAGQRWQLDRHGDLWRGGGWRD